MTRLEAKSLPARHTHGHARHTRGAETKQTADSSGKLQLRRRKATTRGLLQIVPACSHGTGRSTARALRGTGRSGRARASLSLTAISLQRHFEAAFVRLIKTARSCESLCLTHSSLNRKVNSWDLPTPPAPPLPAGSARPESASQPDLPGDATRVSAALSPERLSDLSLCSSFLGTSELSRARRRLRALFERKNNLNL